MEEPVGILMTLILTFFPQRNEQTAFYQQSGVKGLQEPLAEEPRTRSAVATSWEPLVYP